MTPPSVQNQVFAGITAAKKTYTHIIKCIIIILFIYLFFFLFGGMFVFF